MNAAEVLNWHLTEVPASLTNATVISAQALHSLALRSNGTVVAWGNNGAGETNVPSSLSNVIAIAAGYRHNLAVKSDGTVTAWGNNSSGQCNIPPGLSNVVDVAAGSYHSVALLNNGTVVAWGDNGNGETNVPVGLTNVVAIAAAGDPDNGSAYSLALKSDGTVMAWGYSAVVTPLSGLNNVIAIGAGADHALAVRSGPPTPVVTLQPKPQYQLAGGSITFTTQGRGLAAIEYQWQFNAVNISGATNAAFALTNVQSANEGNYRAIISDTNGSTASSNAAFTVVTPPVILSQSLPTNPVAIFHTNLTLIVSAAGIGQLNGFPISYQWRLNGTNISGANGSNYSFLVEANSPGTYSVFVSNAAGSASASWNVTLTYVGSYVDVGTLAYHLATNAVGRTNGFTGTASDQTQLSNWTSARYTNGNFALLTNAVWSTNFWLKAVQGLSATCIGYSNGLGGQTLVTMVSPRHYLDAYHVALAPGTIIAFLDTNNVIYLRTILQKVNIGTNATDIVAHDTTVGILDADLPSSVGFLPVVPTNFSSYLPTNTSSIVQAIGMNQQMRRFSQPMTFKSPYIIDGVNWNSLKAVPFGLGTNWNVGWG